MIVAEPGANPVTGTVAVDAPAAIMTLAKLETAAGLLELRVTNTPPAGAGTGRVKARFCTAAAPAVMVKVRLDGEKLRVPPWPPPTCTCVLAGAKLGAEAVTVADPAAPAVSRDRADEVWPSPMKTLLVFSAATEGLLSVRVTNTPPAGAGAAKVTGKATLSPGFIARLAGSTMEGPLPPAELVSAKAAGAGTPGDKAVTL